MKFLNWSIGIVALVALGVILYPLAVPYIDGGKGRAYRQILDFHTYAHAPRSRQGTRPFLCVSIFSTGDPRHADENLIYADGAVRGRRVLWDYAVQGWGGQTQDTVALGALKALPLLRPGLVGPGEVKEKDLMIVSQDVGGQWKTSYYDRRRLPAQVQGMGALLEAVSQT